MSAFTYERDLEHPVSAEVEQTIHDVLEGHLTSQGLEGVLVNPGLDHDGDPVLFSRRSPAQSNLASCPEGVLAAWFDQIRMLDAEGYPHAFLEAHGMRLEIRQACQRSDGLHADVRIIPIVSPPAPPPRRGLRAPGNDQPPGSHCSKARRASALPAALAGCS